MSLLSLPHIPAVCRFLVERTVTDNKSLAIVSLLHLKIWWQYVVLPYFPKHTKHIPLSVHARRKLLQQSSSVFVRSTFDKIKRTAVTDSNMLSSQNPAANESSGTLTTPSGYSTPRGSVLKEKTPSSRAFCMGGGRQVPAAFDEEDYVVDFDGPDDPRDPQNWSTWKK